MSKIQEPTILYQYKDTAKLKKLLDNLRQFFINNSKESLCNFLDIDNASGLWLDQIGAYLNIPRIFISGQNTFIMDQSLMDDPSFLLDGQGFAPDDVYKAYIKAQILRRNVRFTIDDIISIIRIAIQPTTILVSEFVKEVSIFVGTDDEDQQRIIGLLSFLDEKWFGLPSGGQIKGFPSNTVTS